MSYLWYDLEGLKGGQVVEVDVGTAVNIKLMSYDSFSLYRSGLPYRFYGGYVVGTPCHIKVPYDGAWILVADLSHPGYFQVKNVRVIDERQKEIANATTSSVVEIDSEEKESQTQGRPEVASNFQNAKRFKIAISFPGEYRVMVEDIAEKLALIYGKERILYDSFHRAEFARPNLDIHLQNLYHNESELVVVFICAEYNKKEWCGIEWRSIRNLLNNKEADDRIMFIKCGEGTVDGVFGTIDGYIDSTMIPIADIISDIVNRHSSIIDADLINKVAPDQSESGSHKINDDGFTSEIKIVIDGEVRFFTGKVIEMKHSIDRHPVISTVAGSLIFAIKNNDYTKKIKFDDKFVLSQNVWKVIGVDDTDRHTTTITCKKELITCDDDMENKIANKNNIINA